MGSVRRLRSRPRLPVIATVCVLAGCLIGLSGAGAVLLSKGSGPVHTCVAAKSGAVSVIAAKKKCPKGSKSLVIDQVGPQGPQGVRGIQGIQGVAGPTGPAHSEVVAGPLETLSGSQPTGSIVTSTAGCDHSTYGPNVEAYGGGVVVTPHPTTENNDVVPIQSSYPGEGVTGTNSAIPAVAGVGANAWTGTVVISRMYQGDTATVQAYAICGP